MLVNKSNKKIISRKVRHARNFFQKFIGLMGERKENFDYALVFHQSDESILSSSIHMLFMQFPTDIVWLDSSMKVVDFSKNLRPWTFNASPRKPAKYIIELKPGLIVKAKIKHGDRLLW